MSIKGKCAIVGLGMTAMGKIYGRSASDFAVEAVELALQDAGLTKADVDGLLINANLSREMHHGLQTALGLENLRLLNVMNAYGATAGTMIQYAAMAIIHGLANVVVLVFADAPLKPTRGAGAAYGADLLSLRGMEGLQAAYGIFGPIPGYALAARRHMHLFGTTSEQLGAIAIAQRRWAQMNPAAQMRTPLTMEDYLASRYVVEPLRLYDCCLVSNGGIAVVITSAERARQLRQPPVYILGLGQAAPGGDERADREPGIYTGARQSGETALHMAGIELNDIDICEIYDCYTYTVLVTLEDYGFCAKGEGGAFVADGKLGPGGSLPTNTGGGQLSAYYMWGFTPLSEAIIQARGQAGERQVPKHDLILVSGNGGILQYHSTTILGTQPG
ncbi:thiolase family protein [Thermogemmatispora tikiterensis]|uniref:Sterol carrier protein n=1 Tax=Thermogemmatispora tikiterensis TaxID=1825093 RepID=A0A328VJH2_9CHLR|nr:thiolase family protein [Thermogemmatispora tikiterensis]RAQ97826.1 sterol carrier protein [Thermogemmatispora tikiterensis]